MGVVQKEREQLALAAALVVRRGSALLVSEQPTGPMVMLLGDEQWVSDNPGLAARIRRRQVVGRRAEIDERSNQIGRVAESRERDDLHNAATAAEGRVRARRTQAAKQAAVAAHSPISAPTTPFPRAQNFVQAASQFLSGVGCLQSVTTSTEPQQRQQQVQPLLVQQPGGAPWNQPADSALYDPFDAALDAAANAARGTKRQLHNHTPDRRWQRTEQASAADPGHWVYLDQQDVQHGPFSTAEMRGWYTGGFLHGSQQVRPAAAAGEFAPLQSFTWLSGGGRAFPGGWEERGHQGWPCNVNASTSERSWGRQTAGVARAGSRGWTGNSSPRLVLGWNEDGGRGDGWNNTHDVQHGDRRKRHKRAVPCVCRVLTVRMRSSD
jgi:hypothetical protein